MQLTTARPQPASRTANASAGRCGRPAAAARSRQRVAAARERRTPSARRGEDVLDRLAAVECVAQLDQRRDQPIHRVAQHVMVGCRDVLPDVGRTCGQAGRIIEAAAREGKSWDVLVLLGSEYILKKLGSD